MEGRVESQAPPIVQLCLKLRSLRRPSLLCQDHQLRHKCLNNLLSNRNRSKLCSSRDQAVGTTLHKSHTKYFHIGIPDQQRPLLTSHMRQCLCRAHQQPVPWVWQDHSTMDPQSPGLRTCLSLHSNRKLLARLLCNPKPWGLRCRYK